MPQPQQRAGLNRRRTNANYPRLIPDLVWLVTRISGSEVDLTIGNLNGVMSVVAVPTISVSGNPATCEGATIAGDVVTLSFSDPVDSDAMVTVPQFERSVRTSFGSFLAAGTQRSPYPTAFTFNEVSAPGVLTEQVTVPTGGIGVLELTLPDDAPDGTSRVVHAPQVGLTSVQVNLADSTPFALVNSGYMLLAEKLEGVWTVIYLGTV